MTALLIRSGRAVRNLTHLRGPLSEDPNARILFTLLVSLCAWLGFWHILLVPRSELLRMSVNYLFYAFALTVGILLRLGKMRAAIWVYLVGCWVHATVIVGTTGGIRSPGLPLYASLPVSAAWLLGFRGAVTTAGVCVASSLTFALIELQRGALEPAFTPAPLGIWAYSTLALMISAVPVTQVLRRRTDALTASRRAEQELQRYKEHLEELVEHRTAELVQARDEAQAANRAKSIFLANMSHELRTPLNAILGFSALLRRRGATPEQRRDLDTINRSGEHLLGLIDDVLDVAKIEAGSKTIEIVPCDLRDFIAEVMRMKQPRAEEMHLDLVVEEEPGFPRFVLTDPARLRQILLNLLSNALKFTREGTVTLRLRTGKPVGSNPTVVIFEVVDTGIGIAPEDQPRVFEAFVQVGTIKQRGAGLGLTITRQLVELLDGRIELESKLGGGSVFRVEIPMSLTAEADVPLLHLDDNRNFRLEPGQPEYRVLIAEDQEENWLVLERLLDDAGFRVEIAVNGRQAVEKARAFEPHFIWMDLRLPDMDGMEATRRIRAGERGRQMKIAALTASAFESQRDEILAKGLDDYVRKPYRQSEIFDCMAHHLGARFVPAQALPELVVSDLNVEVVAHLSPGVRDRVRAAVVSLDAEAIAAAIDEIGQIDPGLARVLRKHAEALSYSAIMNAFDSNARSVGV